MGGIVQIDQFLEVARKSFAVEALAEELRPEWVTDAVVASGRQAKRTRLLPPKVMVWFLILLALFRHLSYANLLEKLHGSWWTGQLWSPRNPPTDRAVAPARDRLGVEPMRRLYQRSVGIWNGDSQGFSVGGRRVFALDGVMYKTFDSAENRDYFGIPGSSRGETAFPQLRTVQLADVANRFIVEVEFGPCSTSEQKLTERLLPRIPVGSLLLLDRNFYAFELLCAIVSHGCDFVVRAKTGKTAAKPELVEVLSVGDELVVLSCPPYSRRLHPDLPANLRLRRIRYRVDGGDTVEALTTILDPELVPKEEIADLDHDRWEVETSADEQKTHLCNCATVNRPVPFRGKTPERVEQELYSTLLAYNLVRKLMVSAAVDSGLEPSRISFVAALERVREAVQDMQLLPTARLRNRYRRMIDAIARSVVPLRPGRHVPRGVRVKMSKYRLKKRKCAA